MSCSASRLFLTIILPALIIGHPGGNAATLNEALQQGSFTLRFSIGGWSLWGSKADKRVKTCRLILQPKYFPRDPQHPPVLVFEAASYDPDRLRVRLESPTRSWSIAEAGLQIDNQRFPLATAVEWTTLELKQSPLFVRLLRQKPLYINWFNKEHGEYQSAAFHSQHALSAFKALGTACRLHVDPLLGAPSPAESEELSITPESRFIRQMTYYLHSRYGPGNQQRPRLDWPPSAETRSYLLRYSKDEDLYVSRYLSGAVFASLSKVTYLPRRPIAELDEDARYAEKRKHGEWISFTFHSDMERHCGIASGARILVNPPQLKDLPQWKMPYFLLYVGQSSTKLVTTFAHPNPFALREEIWAYVGGTEYRLKAVGDPTQIMLDSANRDDELEFMRAVQKAPDFLVYGKDWESRDDLYFKYVSSGFREALQLAARNCGRKDLLQWLQ